MSAGLERGGPFGVLLSIMEARRSARRFEPKAVPEALAEGIRRAFDTAPQAGGDRGRRLILLADPEAIRALASAGERAYARKMAEVDSPAVREALGEYGQNFFWFGAAPLLAAAVVRRTPAFLREAAGDEASLIWGGHLSAAMGLLAALLAAEALGLGGCCLGGPLMAKEALEGELGLKGREEISLMAAFGYPEAAGDPMAEEGD